MTKKRKSARDRLSALICVLLTIAVVVIGLMVVHVRKQANIERSGFATSEAASQTSPLGSFNDFDNFEASIRYDGSTVSLRSDEEDYALPVSQGSTASDTSVSSTLPTAPTTADPTATIPQSSATTQRTVPSQQSAAPSQQSTAVATAQTGSTVHNYGQGADYAYAYAGFTPKQADLNAREWNLMLVNRNYILPQDYSPDLSEAVKGSGVRMDSRVSPHYQAMYDAAQKDGITLTPLSGHRRISTQKTNFENKIQKYVNQGYDRAEATRMAAKIILPPGTSEHNAGVAMDIISLDVDFEETKAFAWLQEHAQDYGFILRYPKNKESITEITYEPWHWRYVGVQHAKAIKQSGQTLEEYLGVR